MTYLPNIPSFSSVSEEDQRRILTTASNASREVADFAERHHFSDLVSSRVWPLSLMMAGSYRELETSDIALITKLVVWIFAFDDVMDERGANLDNLNRVVRATSSVTRGEPPTRDFALLPGLVEVRSEFQRLAQWHQLGPSWINAMCTMQRGMLFESYWRVGYSIFGPQALPSEALYIDQAWRSVGVSPMLQSAMLLIADRSIADHQPHLQHLVELASKAIRYANDIQSHQKEREEGNINSLVVLEHANGAPNTEETAEFVRSQALAKIDVLLGKIHQIAATTVTKTGMAERAIEQAATVLCEFYVGHDYHTFSSQH